MELLFEQDPDTFLNGLTCSKVYNQSVSKLLNNYHALSPFSKGRLLEYSEKLLEWDQQNSAHLREVENFRHTQY